MRLEKPLASNHVNELYLGLLAQVDKEGEESSPRGQPTKEIRPLVFQLTDPYNRLVTLPEREVNKAFAVVEALQLVTFSTDADQLMRFNGNIGNWVDPVTNQVEVPYGIALREQFAPLVAELRRDPDSRRAVMSIYDGRLHQRDMLNVPCTCTLQFFIRNERLELTVYMRSNDLWWGFPYDVYQFTVMQELVAQALRLEMGTYTHVAGSGHLYEPFWEKAQELIWGYYEPPTVPDEAGKVVCPIVAQGPFFHALDSVDESIQHAKEVLDLESAEYYQGRKWMEGLDLYDGISTPYDKYLRQLVEYQARKRKREAAKTG